MYISAQCFPNPKTEEANYRFFTFSHEKYEKDWEGLAHRHPHTEIFYVFNGSGTFFANGKNYPLSRGTLIVNNPGVTHSETSSEKNPLEHAVFSVSNLSFSSLKTGGQVFDEQENEPYPFVIENFSESAEIERLTLEIEKEIKEKKPFWEMACRTIFDRLLLVILRGSKLLALPRKNSKKSDVAELVKEYLDAHYSREISLDSLSRIFFVNKYYLAHAFEKRFHIPPIRYLSQLRCDRAKKLLERTDLSVAAIASSVGVPSVSYFSYVYKKFYNESPTQTKRTQD